MMKITLTENKLRSLIKEAIIKHLNEGANDWELADYHSRNASDGPRYCSVERMEKILGNDIELDGEIDDLYLDTVEFHEGYAVLKKINNGEWDHDDYNLVNKRGHLLSREWLAYCLDFQDGIDVVRVKTHSDHKWHLMNKQGRILNKEGYDFIYTFDGGSALVKLNDKYNLIDERGNILSKQWFDDISKFSYEGYALVKTDGKINFINKEGKLKYNQWLIQVSDGYNFLVCYLNGKFYFFDHRNGKLLLNHGFDEKSFNGKTYIEVELNGVLRKISIIKTSQKRGILLKKS